MIVWGGYDAGYLNTGGRYNPSADTWVATSTGAGVPSARSGYTAVWAGTEMIIWGGNDGVYSITYSNTGGRYDPSTDTWAATSTGAGLPSGRNDHTAVWTGIEMIVWGGRPYTQSGGVYTPMDQDRDGVGDTCDACPDSDRTPTVILGTCDSTVPNAALPSGCTIVDRLHQCSRTSHRKSWDNACVESLLHELRRDGYLTAQEAAAIQRCAATTKGGVSGQQRR